MMPYQMSIPAPVAGNIRSSTATATATSAASARAYPVAVSDRDVEHPAGYHQDPYAAELSSDQRRALDAANDSNVSALGLLRSGQDDAAESSVWATAKKWAGQAGQKLQEGEKEVWKRINKEG